VKQKLPLAALVSLVVAAAWVGPYAWMAITSLKTLPELLRAPTALLPETLTLAAYREVWEAVPMARYLVNTAIMAVLIAVLQILLALPAGFALAKLDFVGKKTAFGLVLVCLLIPAQATFVPVFLMLGRAGLVNTMAALVLPFGASALGTFLVRQACLSIPDELIEAARLDGASDLRIVYRLLAPALRPTLAALFLLSFVFHWNDYFWPLLVVTSPDMAMPALGTVYLRNTETGIDYGPLMAGTAIITAPLVIAFLFAQRRFIEGMTLTGLKG